MTLSFRHLNFERNDRKLFQNDLNGHVTASHCLQIMGANGGGKTTLLKMLAGLLEPSHGEILWNSQSIAQFKEEYSQNIQFIGHKNAIKPNLTVYENIHFLSLFYGTSLTPQEITLIIEAIGIPRHSRTLAKQLSAGQMRRLCMAKLLFKKALIWILDEPLTALDHDGQHWFLTLLNQHLANQGLVIMATHRDLSADLHAPVEILYVNAAKDVHG